MFWCSVRSAFAWKNAKTIVERRKNTPTSGARGRAWIHSSVSTTRPTTRTWSPRRFTRRATSSTACCGRPSSSSSAARCSSASSTAAATSPSAAVALRRTKVVRRSPVGAPHRKRATFASWSCAARRRPGDFRFQTGARQSAATWGAPPPSTWSRGSPTRRWSRRSVVLLRRAGRRTRATSRGAQTGGGWSRCGRWRRRRGRDAPTTSWRSFATSGNCRSPFPGKITRPPPKSTSFRADPATYELDRRPLKTGSINNWPGVNNYYTE